MPLKVWHGDTKKKIEIGTPCPLLGFRWSGGKTNRTLHHLAFRSLFSQQTPLDVKRRGEKNPWIDTLFQVARSGSGAFASFSTFTGTGEAVELSKLSATAAEARRELRGEKKWHFSSIFCLLRTGSGAFASPSVLHEKCCCYKILWNTFERFCQSNKIRWHVAAGSKEINVMSSLWSMIHMCRGTGCWLMLN